MRVGTAFGNRRVLRSDQREYYIGLQSYIHVRVTRRLSVHCW